MLDGGTVKRIGTEKANVYLVENYHISQKSMKQGVKVAAAWLLSTQLLIYRKILSHRPMEVPYLCFSSLFLSRLDIKTAYLFLS
jgi:hypothetical protein